MKKTFIFLFIILSFITTLAACKDKSLEIWVGIESQAFYQEKVDEYIKTYNENNKDSFPTKISVKAVDTGTAGGVFLNDPTSAGDIITVAHDNLAKLIAGSSAIAPIRSEALISQIINDNETVYVDAIKGIVQGESYYFGVPYVGQALILYYNTKYIDENQVQSWEGILEAANAAQKQALSLTGTDGFNNSFLLLAVNNETKETSLQLYENGNANNNYATGADVLSFLKYGQKVLFGNKYGAKRPTDSGWQVELQEEVSLSVIGGAWHFAAAKAALGQDLGIAILPTFTLTADTVYDVANNQDLVGQVMRSGTFADVKMFVKNKVSKYADYLDDILMYLSSSKIQEESYVAANNLPAYKHATEEFAALKDENAKTDEEKLALKLAKAQIEMFQYGLPQPFGVHPNFNFFYYSKNGPERIMDILDQTKGTGTFATDKEIFEEMKKIVQIWKTGSEE